MEQNLGVILTTGATIGFLHTVLGPDHYLPFIVMSKARKWSMFRTSLTTILCGIGHVGSSIVIGAVGIAFGFGVHKLTLFESVRGNIAAWAFIIFGFSYFIWGLWRAFKKKKHQHLHFHMDGKAHTHDHNHLSVHAHVHDEHTSEVNLTPWILFTIFVLGPCEPLIPILMYPAAKGSMYGVVLVAVVFSIVTISTMLATVWLGSYGLGLLTMGKLEKYTHAIAGATIFLSGLAIVFLDW